MAYENFSPEMTPDEFLKLYWYKTDLVRICRVLGMICNGTKFELQERVLRFLQTGEKEKKITVSTVSRKSKERKAMSLDTSIVLDGFKLSHEARKFFANYFGRSKFFFTKEMARAVRNAKRDRDTSFTVADLIEVYKKGRQSTPEEEKTLLWNGFVKAFSKDPRTKMIKNRLKVAAFLWGKVRDSESPKVYTPSLFDRYFVEIEPIIIYKESPK